MDDLRELQAEYLRDFRTVTKEKLQVGALVRAVLSTNEGLKFKDGRTAKPKKIIIIGKDKNSDTFFGTVLINTKLNPKAEYSDEIMSTQLLLSQQKYVDFLKYDSFVDCGQVFPLSFEILHNGEYYGLLDEEDKTAIFNILETTKTITTKEKKRFNIRRR